MAKGGTLWIKRSYNFVDKDPEIDVFRTAFQKEKITENDLAVLAGLSNATVHNIFGGKTMWPRHSTFGKIAGAMGYSYGLVRDKEPDYQKVIPEATKQRLEYRRMLARRATPRRKKKAA